MKNKTLNVFIVGANFVNKGAEAMLITVMQHFTKMYENINFFMWCKYFEVELAQSLGITPIYIPRRELRIKSLVLRIYGKLYKIFMGKALPYVDLQEYNRIFKYIGNLDYVIDISGFAYGDVWGTSMATNMLKLMRKSPASKFIFMPQAWGPFSIQRSNSVFKEMLKNAYVFYARDEYSRNALGALLSAPVESIKISNDIVFSLDGKIILQPDLEQVVKSSGKRVIGVSPNMRIYERTGGVAKENQYYKSLLDICKFIMVEVDAIIVLIPNAIKPERKGYPDDRYLCDLLFEDLDNSGECIKFDEYKSAFEIRSIISILDLLIGSRYHALVFAFSMGVPSIALSWSHKYKELFRLFEMEELVVERENYGNIDLIKGKITEILKNHEFYKTMINNRAPELAKNAETVFFKLKDKDT